MQAILRFLTTTLAKYSHSYFRTVIFLIAATFFCSTLTAQSYTWIGSGTTGKGNTANDQNFNNPNNWDAIQVPSALNDVIIKFVTDGTITLTANLTIRNLTITNDNNNTNVYVNVGGFTLTVNGITAVNVTNEHPRNDIHIGVNDAVSKGIIDFVGDVSLGTVNLSDSIFLMGNDSSTIICRGNFTLGSRARIKRDAEPGTLLFDGLGTQNFIYNNVGNACSFKNIVIGKNNNPIVNVTGISTSFDNITGNLTVNGSSILNLSTAQLNRQTNGGVFLLKNTSTIRLAASSSLANGGLATLIPGSNFPSGFINIVLDSTSTVEFYGTNQFIPGAVHNIKGYGNLTLTNNTKTLISSFAMYRGLNIAAGTTMDLNSFDDTLKSNSQTTAYVSAVPPSAVISYGSLGGFVVERYLQAYKSWRLLATPVDISTSPTISAAWRENNAAFTSTGYGTQITGPQGPITANAGAFLDVFTQRGSVKYYNPAADNFVEISNANTTQIANTTGYYVFVRGDRGVPITGAAGSTNLRIKGRLRTGDQIFPVLTNKFASVGNPFASRIDFKKISKSTVVDAFYVWNPNPAGTFYNAGKYEVYVLNADGNYRLGGSAGGAVRNYIESGQAVFIQSVTGGSITVKEFDKFGGSSVVNKGAVIADRQGVNNPTLEINLHTTDGNGKDVLGDGAVLNFDAAFDNDIDNLDVRKILNSSDNLSIKKGNANLVVERRAPLTAKDTIFLNLGNTRIAPYRFKIDPSVLGNLSLKAFLKDKFLQTETPVSLTDVTNVNFTTTADVASRATDRFMIVFKNVAPAVFTAIKAVRNNDNSVAVTWNMRNENNINTYSIERSTDGGTNYTVINSQMPTANNFGSPYYTVTDADAPKEMVWYRIQANNIFNGSFYSDKTDAKAVDVNTKHDISMYPNLVVDGTVNLYFNNQPAGKYNISIVNSKGEQVKFSTVEINNNVGLKNISMKKAAAGMYRAIIKDEKGISVVISFVKL